MRGACPPGLRSQTLVVDGKEYPGDRPTFLVNLRGESPAFLPLQAKPPTPVPDVADTDQNHWPATLQKTAEEARKLMERK